MTRTKTTNNTNLGAGAVQNQTIRSFSLVHLAGDVIAVSQLVAKALASTIEQNGASSAQRFGRKPLD
jgi:hypothetical protein